MLMKLHTRNKLSRSRLGNLVVLVLLAAMGVFTAIPFLFSIVQSIKPVDELFVYPPRLTVSRPTLDNFAVLFNLTSSTWVPVSRYLFNSLLLTVCGTVGNVVVCSMAAYPLAKLKFHGRKLLFNLVVVSLLFTYEVTFIPNYVILSKLQMLDTFWALLLPAVATPMGLFFMKQFMEQIPDSVVESARVDGAGTLTLYWRIVMPQVKPAWLTLVIFSFQSLWNREGLEFIFSEELKMFPTILKQVASSGVARAGAAAAAAVILMIPPIVVFLLSQSNVIETMASSGIKE
ncbi:MAG: carbohydrate ABC transporter permease [Oscillospiraceae bacterium]|nr:carbohydrate ABC transporter permease [Oscillospiraceae bacterium]